MKVKRYKAFLDSAGRPVLREDGGFVADGRVSYNNPEKLADFFGKSVGIRNCAEEHVYVVCLDTRLHLIGCFEASHGSVNGSMFPVREILQKSLMLGAVYIAISHNHPGGICNPSPEDDAATRKIVQACEIVGVPIIDHIVLAWNSEDYYSYQENGKLR